MSFIPSDASPQSSPDPSPSPSPSADLSDRLKTLRDRLTADSEKTQLETLHEIGTLGDPGVELLMDFLSKHQGQEPTYLDGTAYQLLAQQANDDVQAFLARTFAEGLVPLQSDRSVDYRPLQELLVKRDYEEADRVTLRNMCELAGEAAIRRKWLYFTEINSFPSTDLKTIDTLWRVYSEDRFGFSVQRHLWLTLGQDWDRLWPKIGWRSGNTWTRYPGEFIWDLTAPKGHLPLSNQLRGVRAIESIFKHPAWQAPAE